MEKTIKISFDEAQKAVTCSIQITAQVSTPEGTILSPAENGLLLEEAKMLYEEASKYSHAMTVKKTIGGN